MAAWQRRLHAINAAVNSDPAAPQLAPSSATERPAGLTELELKQYQTDGYLFLRG